MEKGDYEAWLTSPGTAKVRGHLRAWREYLKERWAQGHGGELEQVYAQVYGDLADMTFADMDSQRETMRGFYEELKERDEDDEDNG